MDMLAQLRPYRARLRREAAARAALTGCAAALGALLVVFTVFHLLGRPPAAGACAALFALVFALAGALAYALRLRPTLKDTAARIDALGLEERVATMLALRAETTPLCAVQRQDAAAHLARVSPARVRLAFPGRLLALCLLLALLAAGVAALPYGLFAAAPPSAPAETEESRLAREMIDSLRAQIENAAIGEQERAALLSELEALEAGLAGREIGLEDLAQITQATGELYKNLEDVEMFVSWAFQLTKYDCLRELGEAVLAGDMEKISPACANLANRLLMLSGTPQVDALMEVKLALDDALQNGNPTDDEASLCYIFDSLRLDLQSAAVYAFSGKDASATIIGGVQRAEKRLYMYFSGEDVLKAAEEDETQNVNYVQLSGDELADAMAFGASESDLEEGEQEPGELQTLYSGDPDDWHGAGTGTRGEQYHAVTELIYEPSLDPAAGDPAQAADGETRVPYGQVYGDYYARLLEQLEGGEIPGALRDAVEAYFYGL